MSGSIDRMTFSFPKGRVVSERIDEQRDKSALFDPSIQRSCISDLPVEILEDIFIYGARDSLWENSGCFTPDAPSWVNVSYVCRHWRDVALNCSTLWSYLFVGSPRWTEELLARSRNAPLKLLVEVNDFVKTSESALRFVAQVMEEAERIQVLHLRALTSYSDCLAKLAPCAPRLRYLSIYTAFSPWIGPSLLFSTPALRTLKLSRSNMPWNMFNLNHLTTLGLQNVPPELQLNVVDFVSTLSHIPSLAQLYLDGALASATGFRSSDRFHPSQKIDLFHLERLLITEPLSTVIALLSRVNISPKTKVRLQFHEGPEASVDDYTVLSSLVSQMFDTSNQKIRGLVIETERISPPKRVALTFCTSERAHDPFSWHTCLHWERCDVPLQMALCADRSDALVRTVDDLADRIASVLCRSLPLADVRRLHVFNPPRLERFWEALLGRLPDLRRLVMSHGCVAPLTAVLARDREDVLVPAVKELELYDAVVPLPKPVDRVVQLLRRRSMYLCVRMRR